MTNKRNAPCKECEKRYPKCHSTCEKYIDWAEKRRTKTKFEVIDKMLKGYEHSRALRIREWRENRK